MWKKTGFKIFAVTLICVLLSTTFIIPLSAGANDQSDSVFPAQLPPPPDGFNPLTASDSQLKTYGFPDRPTDKYSLREWENMMAHAKYYGKPQQEIRDIRHDYYDTQNLAGIGVWGGNNVRNGYTPTYTGTSARWVMPNYSPGYSGTTEIASYWTGIGGIKGSTYIVQAGADANLAYLGYSPSYEFWVEDYPNNSIYQAYPSVTGGNTVYVSISYGGATSTAFLMNVSSGQYTSVVFNTPYYDGTSANYIFENLYPTPNFVYDNIPTVHFSNTTLYWHDGSGASGGGEFTAYNYTECRQHNIWSFVKAYPTNMSNGAFDVIAHD